MKIAIVGSGFYATEAYLPALVKQTRLQLVAAYSRGIDSALNFRGKLPLGMQASVDLYADTPAEVSRGTYKDLLQNDQIGGLILALPIEAQPRFISEALKAGKHILSEKPIGPTVSLAESLLDEYGLSKQSYMGQVWYVAENWRLLPAVPYAAQRVSSLGRILGFRTRQSFMMNQESPFLSSGWRASPTLGYGPLLLDGAVHGIAVLRYILGPDVELARVGAVSNSLQSYLPAPDTLDAIVTTRNGFTGVMQMSYGTTFCGPVFEIACSDGVVILDGFDSVTVTSSDGRETKHWRGIGGLDNSVALVLEAWAEASAGEGTERRQLSPDEALIDLRIIETLLKSAETNGAPLDLAL